MMTCRKIRERAGYTFLEVAIALSLVAIVFAAAFPMVSAAWQEKRLRAAMDEIAGQVREWRHEAEVGGREKVVAVTAHGLAAGSDEDAAPAVAIPEGVTLKLRFPRGEWEPAKGQPWRIFSLGLVQPLSLRVQLGEMWIETDFDFLTGGVAAERYSF